MKNTLLIICLLLLGSSVYSQSTRKAVDAKGLEVGMMAPDFKAFDSDSSLFSLSAALEKGPIVLVFYRGFWCPVCNQHLSILQDSLQMIQGKGVSVIAVSPEKPEYLNQMAIKTGAEFTLLYDEDYVIANAYDVTFTPSKMTLLTYNVALGAKLKETHSDDSQKLPIPATYLIAKDGRITWRQFDPNYKNRSSVKDILNAIADLAGDK